MYSVGRANSRNLDVGLVSLRPDLSPLKTGFSPKKFQSLNVFFFFFFWCFFESFLKIIMQRGVMRMILGDKEKIGTS